MLPTGGSQTSGVRPVGGQPLRKSSPADMIVVKGVAAVIYSRTSDVHPTGTNRWFAERYNVNNARNFNGNNGNLNNNNVNNRNRAQAVTNLR